MYDIYIRETLRIVRELDGQMEWRQRVFDFRVRTKYIRKNGLAL